MKHVEGEYLLTMEHSQKEGVHVLDVIKGLEDLEKDLGVSFFKDIQVTPEGVLFTWFTEEDEQQ